MPILRTTELQPRRADQYDATSLRAREQAFASLYPTGQTVAAGVSIPQVGVMGKGRHLGATLLGVVDVTGVTGAEVTGTVRLEDAVGIIRNVSFLAALHMTAASKMVFLGCRFAAVLTMDAGAQLAMNGCFLEGTAAVDNAGAAPLANRVGCAGTSSLAADNNVTVTAGF